MIEDEVKGYNRAINVTITILEDLIADDRTPRHSRPLLSSIKEGFKGLRLTEEDLAYVKASEATSD